MLKRTKYSRLHNDSLTSLEDRPQRVLPLKRNLCLDSELAHHGSSTLRDFIPRMANIRIQSPICLRGRTGHTNPSCAPEHDGQTEWIDQRFCSQPSLDAAQSTMAVQCTKRPITLHRMASLPWTPGCAPCDCHSSACLEDCSEKGGVKTAIHHNIKYIGSVEVTQSMRTLDFNTRMQVTREAISKLCQKSSTKTAVKAKRPVHKGLSAVLGQIDLQFSGSRVILSVSTESLTLIDVSSLQKIAHHPMQAISFASGGDPDMADYIAYVAKDLANHRACHILECSRGQAGEVINSIGQAFETRFHQMLSHASPLFSTNHRSAMSPDAEPESAQRDKQKLGQDYYNMVPPKMHPRVGTEDMLMSERDKQQEVIEQHVCLCPPVTLYENCSNTELTLAPPKEVTAGLAPPALCKTPTQDLIQGEDWFHGRLGREQAEALLTYSGDFLVRESSSASGQYVLSGMEGTTVRHLLLVDPLGQVRTRDKVFLSIGHLVRFHMESQMPIHSGTSELCLKQPILLRH